MNRKDIVIGLVILAVLAAIVFWVRKPKTNSLQLPQPTSIEQQMENKFNVQIPENVEKAELSDVSGGTASGIATREYKDGKFTLTVLADLPDLSDGNLYQAWLVNGDKTVSAGQLTLAKGGYLLDFNSSTDYSSYNSIVITSESKLDMIPESHVLEGSF
jgi:hypothetical protein